MPSRKFQAQSSPESVQSNFVVLTILSPSDAGWFVLMKTRKEKGRKGATLDGRYTEELGGNR
jgi:hypothetical protein